LEIRNNEPKTNKRSAWLCADLGLMGYEEAHDLQLRLVAAISSGAIATDILLLTEHSPVFTLGRRGGLTNIRVPKTVFEEAQIPIVHVERGGDITFHGPGQLVGYPVIDLRAAGLTVTAYVERLEEVMIRTAAKFGVHAARNPLNRGIWVGDRKLGSLGIAIRRGIAFHGFALNVNVSLEPFGWIDPCGLQGVKMTSIVREIELERLSNGCETASLDNGRLGRPHTGLESCEAAGLTSKAVREQIKAAIEDVFGVDLQQEVPPSCGLSCVRLLDRTGTNS